MKAPLILSAVICGLIASASAADIKEQAVEYTSGGVVCEGWHAYDAALTGKRPAVLIIHQWTGLTDYEKMRAKMVAELGYNVFVADVYGKGIRPQPPAAGVEAGKYKTNRTLLRERLNSALDVLLKDANTDTTKVAATGYCFGGTAAIELARSGVPLLGVVSFHGGLDSPTPADGKNIKGKVLALHGADDPFVKAADIAAFEDELNAANVSYEIVKYPRAVHAFTQKMAGDDNSKGAAYNADADAKSWIAMKEFLAGIFK